MTYNIKKLVYAAVCVTLGVLLPTIFHLAGSGAGRALLPMHIPVFLCGFICGPVWGLICGLVVPFFASFVTGGAPPLYPVAISMALELATYGLVSGLVFKPNNVLRMYIALVAAMLAGRAVMGIANALMLGLAGKYSFSAFLNGAFIEAFPGIIIQLILIPILILALTKAGLIPIKEKEKTA